MILQTACGDRRFASRLFLKEVDALNNAKARKAWQKLFPYILLLPAGILVVVFKLFPIFSTLKNGFVFNGKFTLSIYQDLFSDPNMWKSLWVTIKFNLITIPLQVCISFCLGLLVSTKMRGINVFRTIFFSTFAVSVAVSTLIWEKMFNYNSGFFNSLLGVFGVEPQGFLTSSSQALLCIIVMVTWKGCGYWMMFFMSGLKNIDTSIYESAKVDGANLFTMITRITIPLLSKVILFVCVANTTANMLLFAPVQMTTEGGPQGSTNLLMYEAYKSAFRYADQERAAAIVTVLVLMIGVVCFVQFKFIDRSEEA